MHKMAKLVLIQSMAGLVVCYCRITQGFTFVEVDLEVHGKTFLMVDELLEPCYSDSSIFVLHKFFVFSLAVETVQIQTVWAGHHRPL